MEAEAEGRTWKEMFERRWPAIAYYVCAGMPDSWYKEIYLKWDAQEA
jgi:hypothetical protein